MRRIEVDPEVYALLEAHARGFETPNDVLRRMLPWGDTQPGLTEGEGSRSGTLQRSGRLLPLMQASLINAGDNLAYHRTRKGDVLHARVGDHGAVVTERGEYESPSPALADLAGYQVDGWANWVHVPSGRSLRDLRSEVRPAN
jgi:hypothetical protein